MNIDEGSFAAHQFSQYERRPPRRNDFGAFRDRTELSGPVIDKLRPGLILAVLRMRCVGGYWIMVVPQTRMRRGGSARRRRQSPFACTAQSGIFGRGTSYSVFSQAVPERRRYRPRLRHRVLGGLSHEGYSPPHKLKAGGQPRHALE